MHGQTPSGVGEMPGSQVSKLETWGTRFRGQNDFQARTFFPTLPNERMPSLPATLVTTVSISEPFSTTTKFVTTGGLPSVKSMVKVPVQSAFTVYLPVAGV